MTIMKKITKRKTVKQQETSDGESNSGSDTLDVLVDDGFQQVGGGDDDFIWKINQEKMQLKTTAALLPDPNDYILELFSFVHNTSPSKIKVKTKYSQTEIVGDGHGFDLADLDSLMSVFFVVPDDSADLYKRFGGLATAIYSAINTSASKIVIETRKDNVSLRYTVRAGTYNAANLNERINSIRFGENKISFTHDEKSSVKSGVKITVSKNVPLKNKIIDIVRFNTKGIEFNKIKNYCAQSLTPTFLNNVDIWDRGSLEKTAFSARTFFTSSNKLEKYELKITEKKFNAILWLDSRKYINKLTLLRSGVNHPFDDSNVYAMVPPFPESNLILDSPYFQVHMDKSGKLKEIPYLARDFTNPLEKHFSELYTQIINDFIPLADKKSSKDFSYEDHSNYNLLEPLIHEMIRRMDHNFIVDKDKYPADDYRKKLLDLPLIKIITNPTAPDEYISFNTLLDTYKSKQIYTTGRTFPVLSPDWNEGNLLCRTDNLLKRFCEEHAVPFQDYDEIVNARNADQRNKENLERKILKEQLKEQKKTEFKKKRNAFSELLSYLFKWSNNSTKKSRGNVSVGDSLSTIVSGAGLTTIGTVSMVGAGLIMLPVLAPLAVLCSVAYLGKKGKEYAAPHALSFYTKAQQFYAAHLEERVQKTKLSFSAKYTAFKTGYRQMKTRTGTKISHVYDSASHAVTKTTSAIGSTVASGVTYVSTKAYHAGSACIRPVARAGSFVYSETIQGISGMYSATSDAFVSLKEGYAQFRRDRKERFKTNRMLRTQREKEKISAYEALHPEESSTEKARIQREKRAEKDRRSIEKQTKRLERKQARENLREKSREERKKLRRDAQLKEEQELIDKYNVLKDQHITGAKSIFDAYTKVVDKYGVLRNIFPKFGFALAKYPRMDPKTKNVMFEDKFFFSSKKSAMYPNSNQPYTISLPEGLSLLHRDRTYQEPRTTGRAEVYVDTRSKENLEYGKAIGSRKGFFALAPYIIGLFDHEKNLRYSTQDRTETLSFYDSRMKDSYTQYKRAFDNETPLSMLVLDFYGKVFEEIKDAKVYHAIDLYHAGNETAFIQTFEKLSDEEVRKTIKKLVRMDTPNQTIDAYVANKCSGLIEEIGRAEI